MINVDSGGVEVYPHDVEEVIARHPQVAEAVVFGIPDEKWGETPVAAVTLRAGASIDAETLRAWATTATIPAAATAVDPVAAPADRIRPGLWRYSYRGWQLCKDWVV